MIAVDIFADLYEWDDRQRARAHRVADTSKTLFAMARGKAAGPLIFIDAALAVADAIGAYCRNRQAKEVTRQLEIEGDKLLRLLAELDVKLAFRAAIADLEFESKLNGLRMRLQQQVLEVAMSEKIFAGLSGQVRQLGQAIAALRREAPPMCGHLLQLESVYYQLVDVQLQTAMDFVKE
jgi:hypothetical protein